MKKSLFTVSLLFSVLAQAQPAVLGQPVYGGNGCPAGTAQFVLSPDRTSAILLTNEFEVHSDQNTNRPIDRSSCNIALPVQLADGYQAAFLVEARGAAQPHNGGFVTFDQEVFIAGSRGPRLQKTYRAPSSIKVSNASSLSSEAVWSPCGADINLRANLSLASQRDATAHIDQIRIKPVIRRCR